MNKIKKIFSVLSSINFSRNKLTPKVLKELRDFGRFDYSYNPEVFSASAFFTVFLEREHYSNVKGLLNKFKTNYFGEIVDGKVVFEGYQPKELYQLVEFISANDLWATKEDRDNPDGKRFYKVVEHIKASGNEKLIGTLLKYDFNEFRVAYGCVADESFEKIIKLSPADAGMLGISIIDNTFKAKRKFKSRVKLLLFIAYLFMFIYLLSLLFTFFN